MKARFAPIASQWIVAQVFPAPRIRSQAIAYCGRADNLQAERWESRGGQRRQSSSGKRK